MPLCGAAEKLEPIFDGKTLRGWTLCAGQAKYEVVDGAIVGTTVKGSPNSFLCADKEYGDFILEFESNNDPELNSGVQLRSHRYTRPTTVMIENKGLRKREMPKGHVYGYQLEISNQERGTSGGIFDEARRGWIGDVSKNANCGKAFQDKQWNKFRVEARGGSIKTFINGVACADLVDSMDLSGFIALQVHSFPGDKPAQVRWRNIRLADLGRHAWQPLWDGRSLKGWTSWGGGQWSIVDGALKGTQAPSSTERGFLLSDDSFRDFTVRLKYKAVKGNSGFFFRMGDPAAAKSVLGYEIEVDPTRDPGGLQEVRGRGWLLRTGPIADAWYYNKDGWNEMVVSAHGRRIAVHINGYRTADVANDPGPVEGRFGLQLNPKQDLEVHFKDIEILRPAN